MKIGFLSMQSPVRRRRARPAWPLLSMLPLALLFSCRPAGAQTAVPEYQLKAAVIFNFAVFAEWPPAALPPTAPLALCAYNGNPLLAALQALADKNVNGHRLEVRTLPGGAAARDCHLLVLDRRDRERWPQLHRDLGTSAVLTIADDKQIGADGAMLVLSMDDQRIAFDANLAALRGAGLTLSSKLLRLARSAR